MEKPFTFKYDAPEGVYIAAALREKAAAETAEAEELETKAFHGSLMSDTHEMRAHEARSRAALLSQAADAIHTPVRKAAAADMETALKNAQL